MNIVILSYRVSGNDGVSLECKHWKKILNRMGHNVSFLAGELDASGTIIPELHFQWPDVMEIHDRVAYGPGSYEQIEERIFDLAGTIEGKLRKYFRNRKKVDLLIVANVLSLPMHFPLAVALSRIIDEMKLPVIARHHDFWWERQRYLKSNLFPFFERWFPPDINSIRHVVINSAAQKELKKRTDLKSAIISDSFNFRNKKKSKIDSYSKDFRKDFRISDEDIVFLQATRIVPRKRIEIAIDLIKKLNDPRIIFIVAGQSGDEGKEYEIKLKKYAKKLGIRHKFIGNRIDSQRRVVALAGGGRQKRKKIYTLWDAYTNSDIVTYPTEIEGFGNQFIEAVYFKKPVILTPYPVYNDDIDPLGFDVIKIQKNISNKSIQEIRNLIDNPVRRKQMTDKNFELGKKNFSYVATAAKIQKLIDSF